MGTLNIQPVQTTMERKVQMDALIQDIDALNMMINNGMIESSIQRIGAEQEICFVNKNHQPSPINSKVLEAINDNHFTYEHASFNAEINIDPLPFRGNCLSQMESNLLDHLGTLEKVAKQHQSDIVLVGILPTIEREHLSPDYFTSVGRYQTINKLLSEIRGEPYELHIEGTDQLITRHDTTMFEACTTSFQIHLQVSAEDFCKKYNWSQAISGPVLAAMTNSPLLLGKRLWRETRIALFQQAIDARKPSFVVTEKAPRVTFGDEWIKDSILEIYKDDIARYPMLLHKKNSENSIEALKTGLIPQLEALTTHNGTVYRWNRGCYGITDGKPHLRIECRYIPSGPTVVDEVANSAFWLGLMNAQPEALEDLTTIMAFDDVKSNFVKAARMGLGAQFNWIKHKRIPAKELILKELLPMAKIGLQKAGIIEKDIDKYLDIIEERVTTEKTGSQWILDAFKKYQLTEPNALAAIRLTSQIGENQKENIPVHRWGFKPKANETIRLSDMKVSQVMTRDLFTVHDNAPLKLAGNMMAWKKVRHIPVEDRSGKLKGLITTGILLEHLAKKHSESTIRDIMIREPIVVSPEASLTEAITLMTENDIGALPVIRQQYLVGIITERDIMKLSEKWFKKSNNGNSH